MFTPLVLAAGPFKRAHVLVLSNTARRQGQAAAVLEESALRGGERARILVGLQAPCSDDGLRMLNRVTLGKGREDKASVHTLLRRL